MVVYIINSQLRHLVVVHIINSQLRHLVVVHIIKVTQLRHLVVVFIRQLDENKEKLLTMALRQQSQTNAFRWADMVFPGGAVAVVGAVLRSVIH